MKLYELERNTKFKLLEEPQIPPVAPNGVVGKVYTLRNIDGMYSYVKDDDGNVYHFAAWTEVEAVEDSKEEV